MDQLLRSVTKLQGPAIKTVGREVHLLMTGLDADVQCGIVQGK